MTALSILVAAHVFFMAFVIGGYFVALTQQGRVNPILSWGARLQLVTGFALMLWPDTAHDDMVLGIKFVVTFALVALLEIARAKQGKDEPKPMLVHIAGALAVVAFVIGILLSNGVL